MKELGLGRAGHLSEYEEPPVKEKQKFKPRYTAIHDEILHSIREGKWIKGDRLPTEKELCSAYGVSRITVVRALAELKKEGLIESRQGSGSYVLWTPDFEYYRLKKPRIIRSGRIRIIHSLLGASQQKHFQMKLLAETFMNVNPDIEIEFIYLKSEKDPYLPRIARGNVPSCGEFFWHAAYVERNALLPLDTLDGFEAVCKNLLPALPKGTVYALPSHIGIPNFLLINMKLVEDAGLHLPDPPRTWHQLIRLQRELSGRLGNFAHTTGFPLPDSWHNVKNFAELLGQEIFGGDPDPYSRETFRRLFFTEGAKKGLRILQNLRDGGGVTFNMPHEHFALGKIAILPFASSWDLDLRQFLNAGFPIRCSPMPPVWKSVYRPFYSWFSLGLFREGIHSIAERNAAWSWLKFLLLPSSQQLSSAPSFQLSVLREGMLSFSEEEFPEAHALAVRQFQYAVPQFDFPGIRSAYAEAGAFLREFLLGKYDAEECLQKLRKSIR